MIRKDFLLKFRKDEMPKQDADKNTIEDDNYLIVASRPIKERDIAKMPDSKLENFVDKILFDNKSNKLLFASTYKKEIEIMKKSQLIIKVLQHSDNKAPAKANYNILKNREKHEIIAQAKNDIDIVKKKKNDENLQKIKGNEEFFKEILEEKQRVVNTDKKYKREL